ncbi:MAG: NADH-quinone oxidoreductase subunit C [Magnetococcales bacterium]|nr:NADH-quinone oxidoreductase subunit C [Magnetococcales bacterium]
MTPEKLAHLEGVVGEKFPGLPRERAGEALVIRVTPDTLVTTMTRLRDDPDLDFRLLVDLAGVHYPDREKPLEVVYQLLSVHRNHRLRVKVAVREEEPVPSVIGVWSSANWYEREAYEMFGILFSGHPDLRRLLTEYDFSGYPLRKEFPVTGHFEVRYDANRARVVREPTRLSIPAREYYGRENGSGRSQTDPDRKVGG